MCKGKAQPLDKRVFELMAALVWGTVMYQFNNERERLAGGMVSSMQYLYHDSECIFAARAKLISSVGEYWSNLKTLLWRE